MEYIVTVCPGRADCQNYMHFISFFLLLLLLHIFFSTNKTLPPLPPRPNDGLGESVSLRSRLPLRQSDCAKSRILL